MKSSSIISLFVAVSVSAITVVPGDAQPLPDLKAGEMEEQELAVDHIDQEIEKLETEKHEMIDILAEEQKEDDLAKQISDLQEQEQAVQEELEENREKLGEEQGEGEGAATDGNNEEGTPADPVQDEPAQEEQAVDTADTSEAEDPVEETDEDDPNKPAETHPTAKNLFGEPLQKCSSDSMAITGFLDTGFCVDVEGYDHNHHLICVALHETGSPGYLYGEYDFCEVIGDTKPVNWCDADLPCHHDENQLCPVEDWCVGEIDLANFIDEAVGCDKLGTIHCEATNEDVITHLEGIVDREEDDHMKYEIALACIKERCGETIHRKD